MPDIRVITPDELKGAGEVGPFPIEQFNLKFLAQGDSWFSIGAIPPHATTNLLNKITIKTKALAVNCARPGAELVHMTDTTTNTTFLQLLNGATAQKWDALLLSGLGNDVISACRSSRTETPDKRLLATPAEWGSLPAPERYISKAGWEKFSVHAQKVVELLVQQRDKAPINRGIPIVVHHYDLVTPRNTGPGLGFETWLFPAMNSYQVPIEDWALLLQELMQRTARLIDDIAKQDSSFHVVKTQGLLERAQPQDLGATKHWQNEIHPTKKGYALLSQRWARVLDSMFP